ncbi:ABC transporter permease [Mycoplasma sp. NEAQ87857]|uniref:ABC transporter permease n=1 Tax=Mycoplasma sp. NEAQ87857 TaxID=2683967 RepID=UPI00131824C0|nr:ABC transporter permease [Mycoplasma sp. NEAQ87857]QGZ97631.1 ABC transporter permease [Mycoplasma sp. NEAQ87857]
MTLIITYGLMFFAILILGTISGIFSERVGIVNIAINGFLIFGAISYLYISEFLWKAITGGNSELKISAWYQIIATLFSAILTSLFAVLFGFATIKLKSEQTISGFAMNILAVGIAALLIIVLTKLQGQGSQIASRYKTELALSGAPADWRNIISFKLFIAIIVSVSAWFALRKTKWGLRFRSIGENPQAADVAGINVNKTKWQGIIIAGFVAGIGGSIFAEMNSAEFSVTHDVQGLGYIALAIMITSRWKVSLSILVSLFFSLLLSTSFFGVSLFGAGFSKYKELFYTLPYIITLVIMVFGSKGSVGPAAAGVPYDKSKR